MRLPISGEGFVSYAWVLGSALGVIADAYCKFGVLESALRIDLSCPWAGLMDWKAVNTDTPSSTERREDGSMLKAASGRGNQSSHLFCRLCVIYCLLSTFLASLTILNAIRCLQDTAFKPRLFDCICIVSLLGRLFVSPR